MEWVERKGQLNWLSVVALSVTGFLLVLPGCGGCGESAGGSVEGNSAPNHATPSEVSGYGCKAPWCVDATRTCDDLIRSTCGADMFDYNQYKITPPDIGHEDEAFHAAVAACSRALISDLWETVGEKTREKHPEMSPKALAQLVRLNTGKAIGFSARCTRNAMNCGEMRECLRGSYIPAHPPSWVKLPEPVHAPAPPKPAYWQADYHG